ncbi:uncharacterized protein LOC142235816 [Haematobia irritans]|uniref:uncharacterized protein LOC142235816 n=1 Tax=Haematobia irritans TaxID=7368 RepID=UPI003F507BCC
MVSMYRLFKLVIKIFILQYVEAKRELKIEILDFQVNVTDASMISESIYSTFNKQQLTLEFSTTKRIFEWSGILNIEILPSSKPPTHILTLNANICDCLRSACRNNLVVAFFKEILRTSNFPPKCPLLANNKYYLKNYTTRAKDYPAYLPTVVWQVHIDMLFNKKSAMIWYIKGRTLKV